MINKRFQQACCDGDLDLVTELLSNPDLDINEKFNFEIQEDFSIIYSPLSIASRNGYTEIVKLLLQDSRLDLNSAQDDEHPPFWIACQNGCLETAKILSNDPRIDIRWSYEPDFTSMVNAFFNQNTSVIELIRELLAPKGDQASGNSSYFLERSSRSLLF